ncbi:hypothetical protein Tco_1514946 [Tanacetum coccineum]
MLPRASPDMYQVCCQTKPRRLTSTSVRFDKYISGLSDNIYGNVKSSKPKMLDETIELANDLMDQKLRTYAERQIDNKRKADDSSRTPMVLEQQPQEQNVAKVYNMGRVKRSRMVDLCPSAPSAIFITMARVLRNATNVTSKALAATQRFLADANIANAQKDNRAVPKGKYMYEMLSSRTFQREIESPK